MESNKKIKILKGGLAIVSIGFITLIANELKKSKPTDKIAGLDYEARKKIAFSIIAIGGAVALTPSFIK